MQVILRDDLDNLGKSGDVVSVKEGNIVSSRLTYAAILRGCLTLVFLRKILGSRVVEKRSHHTLSVIC